VVHQALDPASRAHRVAAGTEKGVRHPDAEHHRDELHRMERQRLQDDIPAAARDDPVTIRLGRSGVAEFSGPAFPRQSVHLKERRRLDAARSVRQVALARQVAQAVLQAAQESSPLLAGLPSALAREPLSQEEQVSAQVDEELLRVKRVAQPKRVRPRKGELPEGLGEADSL
jgi:hypothetical protein